MGALDPITGFLNAWTETNKSIQMVGAAVTQFLTWKQKHDTEVWLQQSNNAFRPISNGPSTPDEKDKAAKDIGDLTTKL